MLIEENFLITVALSLLCFIGHEKHVFCNQMKNGLEDGKQ